MRRASRLFDRLLVAVAAFGLATIVFGFSRSFVLTLLALAGEVARLLNGTGREAFNAIKMLKTADPSKYEPAAGADRAANGAPDIEPEKERFFS